MFQPLNDCDDVCGNESLFILWIDRRNCYVCRETSQGTRCAFNCPLFLPGLHLRPTTPNNPHPWKSEWGDNIKDGEGSSPRLYAHLTLYGSVN